MMPENRKLKLLVSRETLDVIIEMSAAPQRSSASRTSESHRLDVRVDPLVLNSFDSQYTRRLCRHVSCDAYYLREPVSAFQWLSQQVQSWKSKRYLVRGNARASEIGHCWSPRSSSPLSTPLWENNRRGLLSLRVTLSSGDFALSRRRRRQQRRGRRRRRA